MSRHTNIVDIPDLDAQFGRLRSMKSMAINTMHHRVQSTNMLFPSNVDPMAQVPRNGLRVAPTEARAARAANPFDISSQWAAQQQLDLSEQDIPARLMQPGSMDASANISFIQQSYTPEQLQRAQTNARGLQAGFEILPMFGDKPPQSSRSSPRLGFSSTAGDSSHYSLGFGFDTSGHYSYKPDVAGVVIDAGVDESMAEWEQELFRSYRKMKYYGEEEHSKEKTIEIVTKFTAAARGAYEKLETAAHSDAVSQGFKLFFRSIKSFEHLTRMGFKNLDKILDGQTPTSIVPIYSVLHVAYAISQTTSENLPQLTDAPSVAAFREDAQTYWKKCLQGGSNSLGFSEQHVFEELLAVMTQEIDAALEWISTRTCLTTWTNVEEDEEESASFNYVLQQSRQPSIVESEHAQSDIFNNSNPLDPSLGNLPTQALPPERRRSVSPWGAVVQGSTFSHLISFLESLDSLGTMFNNLSFGSSHNENHHVTKQRPSCKPPTMQDFKSLIVRGVIGQIWKAKRFNWVGHIMRAAINMVQLGVIQYLRDFENYVLGLTKYCEETPKRLEFTCNFLQICERLAPMFIDLSTRADQTPYSSEYTNVRLTEELQLFRQKQIAEAPYAYMSIPSADMGMPMNTPDMMQLDPSIGSNLGQAGMDNMGMMNSWDGYGSVSYPEYSTMPMTWNTDLSSLSESMDSTETEDTSYQYNTPTPPSTTWMDHAGLDAMANFQFPKKPVEPTQKFLFELKAGEVFPISERFAAFNYSRRHSEADCSFRTSSASPASTSSNGVQRRQSTPLTTVSETSSKPVDIGSHRTTRIRKSSRGNRPAEGRVFICDHPGCGAEIRGSKSTMSNSNLLRHKRSAHPETESWPDVMCEIAGCTATYRGSRGRENLKTHMKNKHKLVFEAQRRRQSIMSDIE
ncbi:hypothetical protein H072_2967 [Dactylellina haptotyla CBS 200.50]|uniref:C2H2-type domain-containing protein n=1 Tax=Dactylellina haptotyla (strain CBS 200.50) TaxID=1284197 RepID=S8AJA6_DACHA|nr:hypothetical protein H072_2967 [Dactylellina haptotyla CBS 200.50]